MNLLEFSKRFPDEKSCRNHIKTLRESRGITCDNKNTTTGEKCGCTKHYWLEKIEKFQCSECNSRTNLKSGTILENSKVDFRTWFMCIHLMTSIKKPFSSLELQRQLGVKRYETVWYMMNKIRRSMGNRDERYLLKGDIEVDDAFFEVVDLPKKDELGNIITEDLRRGRGSQRQQKVLVMVESTPNPHQNNKHKKKRVLGFVKMIVIDELTSDEINYVVHKSIDPTSHIISDGYRGYSQLDCVVDRHTPMRVRPEEAMIKLPWVHTVISNVKRELLGVHHSIGKDYLQNYLDEFCYKLNRRNFEVDLFDRMLICGSDEPWYI